MGTEIFNIDASWAQKFTKTESAILIRAKCMPYFSNDDDDDDEEWERWLEECRNNDRLQDEMRERARQKREKKKILYDLAEAEKRILHTQLLEVYMKRMDNLKKAARAT